MDPCASESRDFLSSWKRDPTARDDDLVVATVQFRSVARVAKRHDARAARRQELCAEATEAQEREVYGGVVVDDDHGDGGSFSEEEERVLQRLDFSSFPNVGPTSASRLRPQSAHVYRRVEPSSCGVSRPQSAKTSRRTSGVSPSKPPDFAWMPAAIKASKWTKMLQSGPRFQERKLQQLEAETYALLQQVLRAPSRHYPRSHHTTGDARGLHSLSSAQESAEKKKKSHHIKSSRVTRTGLSTGGVAVGSGLQVARNNSKVAPRPWTTAHRSLPDGKRVDSAREWSCLSRSSHSAHRGGAFDRRAVLEKTRARTKSTAQDRKANEGSIEGFDKAVKNQHADAEMSAKVVREVGRQDANVHDRHSKIAKKHKPKAEDGDSHLVAVWTGSFESKATESLDDDQEISASALRTKAIEIGRDLASTAISASGSSGDREEIFKCVDNAILKRPAVDQVRPSLPYEVPSTSCPRIRTECLESVSEQAATQSGHGAAHKVEMNARCTSIPGQRSTGDLSVTSPVAKSQLPPSAPPDNTCSNADIEHDGIGLGDLVPLSATSFHQTETKLPCSETVDRDEDERPAPFGAIISTTMSHPNYEDQLQDGERECGSAWSHQNPSFKDAIKVDEATQGGVSLPVPSLLSDRHALVGVDLTLLTTEVANLPPVTRKRSSHVLGQLAAIDSAVSTNEEGDREKRDFGGYTIGHRDVDAPAAFLRDEAFPADDDPLFLEDTGSGDCAICISPRIETGGILQGQGRVQDKRAEGPPRGPPAKRTAHEAQVAERHSRGDVSKSVAVAPGTAAITRTVRDLQPLTIPQQDDVGDTPTREPRSSADPSIRRHPLDLEAKIDVATSERKLGDESFFNLEVETDQEDAASTPPQSVLEPETTHRVSISQTPRCDQSHKIEEQWRAEAVHRIQTTWQVVRAEQPRGCGCQHSSTEDPSGIKQGRDCEAQNLVPFQFVPADLRLRLGECKDAFAEVEGFQSETRSHEDSAAFQRDVAVAHIQQQYRRHVDRRELLDQLAFVVRQHRRESRKRNRQLSLIRSGQGVIEPNSGPHVAPDDAVVGLSSGSPPRLQSKDVSAECKHTSCDALPRRRSDEATDPLREVLEEGPHADQSPVARETNTGTTETLGEPSRLSSSDLSTSDDTRTPCGVGIVQNGPVDDEQIAQVGATPTARDAAAATTTTAAVATWERYMDIATSKSFYYNPKRQVSQWDRPIEANSAVVDRTIDQAVVSEVEDHQVQDTDASTPLGLRDRWERYMDTATNKSFYYNRAYQFSQWERPHDGSVVNTVVTQQDAREHDSPDSLYDKGGEHHTKPDAAARESFGHENGEMFYDHVGQDEYGEVATATAALLNGRSERRTSRDDHVSEWQAFVDDASNQTFYYNRRSGESTWDKPLVFVLPSLAENTAGERNHQDTETKQPSSINLVMEESQGVSTWDSPVDSDHGHPDLLRVQQWNEPPVEMVTEGDAGSPSSPVDGDDDYVISIHDDEDATKWLTT